MDESKQEQRLIEAFMKNFFLTNFSFGYSFLYCHIFLSFRNSKRKNRFQLADINLKVRTNAGKNVIKFENN